MMRSLAITGTTLILIACSGSETATSLPEPVVIVGDSLGTLVSSGIPSPDGTRIAFVQTVAGKAAIFVAAADGSNPKRISHGVWDFEPWWSPDGKWIAYFGESPDFDLFVVSADGGEPRLLAGGPTRDSPRGWVHDGSGVVVARTRAGDDHPVLVPFDGSPARRLGPVMEGDMHGNLSPDGSRFAFDVHAAGGGSIIWVQDSAGTGTPRQLTTENMENLAPALTWSPDSRSITFTSARTGTTDIWIADVVSGETRQLTNDVRNDINPRWSPDGRWIAFLSDRGGQTDIWLMPAAGGDARRVTNDRLVETNPRWAPDGQSLFYRTDQTDTEVVLLPPGGGAGRSLLSWPGFNIGAASVSPDGKTILIASNRSGNLDIWSLPVAGGEPVPFAVSPLGDGDPRYSPDGTQVLFSSDRAGSNDLWIAPAAGGEARQLTQGPDNDGAGHWSPDGQTIAFISNRGGAGGDLWLVPASGGQPTRLTERMRPQDLEWSPDGKQVFFVGARADGGNELYRIPAGGGRPEALGARPGIGNLDLSRDGSQVAYASFEGGWAFVDVIPAAGGPPRRLTKETEGVFQSYMQLTPDGTALVVQTLDLAGNRDANDLWAVNLSDGTWQRLTSTPLVSEFLAGFTSDGQMVVVTGTSRNSIRQVRVGDLLARADTARP